MEKETYKDGDFYKEAYGNVTVGYLEENLENLQPVRLEDEKIRTLVASGYDCRRGTSVSWPVLYHLSHLRANLTEWLPIRETDRVLEMGADTGQLTAGFIKKAKTVVCLEENISRSRILAQRYADARNLEVYAGDPWTVLDTFTEERKVFDWIIAPGILAEAGKYFSCPHSEVSAIIKLKNYLASGGHLVLAADNRFGLKYWAGAMEPHTGRYFDSLEGNGHTFSKQELLQIFEKSGCEDIRFYYPYPERWFPNAVYSDEYLPKAGELNHNLRNFEGERLVLFDEEKVYDQLIADGRFPEYANAYLCVAGPAPEEQIIYTKYSNDRSDRFMIRTDIVKGPNGKEVRKVPLTGEAKKHIENMACQEQALNEQYMKSPVRVNRCRLQEESACFEYLQGKTYEERLDEHRKQKDYEGLFEDLLAFKRLLLDALEESLCPFSKSEIFTEMFGNPEFSKVYKGAVFNNLDWIFGNLMEAEDSFWIIDYEWTFPVQVPVEYLLWRAIHLYLHSREDLQGLGLMAQMGISGEEEKIFSDMEHHFQLWLLDGTATIGAQYLATAGRTIRLEEMVKEVKKDRIQVYVDMGKGFCEEESFWVNAKPDKRGVTHMELLLPQGATAVRLDPAEQTCLVKVKRLLGELGGTYPISYSHNGRELEDQGILYTTIDPQIVVTNLVAGTGRLYGELVIEELHPDTAYACMHLLNRVRSAERLYASAPFRFLKKLKNIKSAKPRRLRGGAELK